MKHFRIFLLSLTLLLFCAGCSVGPEHDIQITIPAHSTEGYFFSEEEISPRFSTVTLSPGKGLGDCAVGLRETDSSEFVSEPEYMTGGTSVKVKANRGTWYRVGVSTINDTDQDKIIYVQVKGADLQIQ